jgi:hypothetical protein
MMSDGPVAEPTRVALDPNTLRDLASRLRSARLPRGAVQTWERGTPEPWLAELVDDWLAFDADTLQNLLDGQRHVQVNLDGVALHALVAPGRGPDPLPLLLTHGWPSSFLEYTKVLPLLTDPGAHGGSHDDAFITPTSGLCR